MDYLPATSDDCRHVGVMSFTYDVKGFFDNKKEEENSFFVLFTPFATFSFLDDLTVCPQGIWNLQSNQQWVRMGLG